MLSHAAASSPPAHAYCPSMIRQVFTILQSALGSWQIGNGAQHSASTTSAAALALVLRGNAPLGAAGGVAADAAAVAGLPRVPCADAIRVPRTDGAGASGVNVLRVGADADLVVQRDNQQEVAHLQQIRVKGYDCLKGPVSCTGTWTVLRCGLSPSVWAGKQIGRGA